MQETAPEPPTSMKPSEAIAPSRHVAYVPDPGLLSGPQLLSCWRVREVQRTKRGDVARRKSRGGRAADVIGRAKQLAVVAEITGAVSGLAEQVHDVREVRGVLQAERVSKLVQRGEVDNDVARHRVDLDRRIGGDGDFSGIDQPGQRIDARPRLTVIPVSPVEEDTN